MSRELPSPGSPEARRMYCTCSSLNDKQFKESLLVEIFGIDFGDLDDFEVYLYATNSNCPLHGNNPEHDLPKGL